MAAGWAVLKSQPRREPVAARAVTARGVKSYVPTLPSRRASALAMPLFPGYLFAHIREETDDLLRIRSAPGVAYVLPRAGKAALLPDDIIAAMRSREAELSGAACEVMFNHGDAVRVAAGPFKWVEGLFDRSLTPSGRVRILLDLVHGTAALDIAATDLEPALSHHA